MKTVFPYALAVPVLFLVAMSACGETTRVEGFPDKYVGIGCELTVKNNRVMVIKPLKGGPAQAAGIKPGDRIIHINGKTTDGLSLGDVVHRLRGLPNSQLTLGLERKGTKMVVVLKRRKLKRKKTGDYEATK